MTHLSSRFHAGPIAASQSDIVSLSEATAAKPARHANRPPIWIPLIMLGVLSCLVRLDDLDLSVQRMFWSPEGGWQLADRAWVQFLYDYGTWPSLIVVGIGLLAWLASFRMPRLRPIRRFGGFLALAMILGPGLVINVAFKDHFGRPRPKQIQEFGGSGAFRPLGEPTFHAGERSFPSGHASMGFFWFAPGIYFWQRHRRVALGFAALALLHGSLMSLGRMAQGAHWFSDSLWAAGMVYLCSWVLYRCVFGPFFLTTSVRELNSTAPELMRTG